MANCASGPHHGPGMATRLIVPEEPVRPATVGISQQMQLEFAAGVTDFDDKPAVILVCVRVGHGLLPAHPMLGKEHEQLRLRQLVSKAAIAPEHRCNYAITEQRLQLCGAGGNLAREMLAEGLYLDRLAGFRIFDQRANFGFRNAVADHEFDALALLRRWLECAAH